MNFVREFGAINKNDVHLAGGKGASLGEMTQAGIPVPPGFVVLRDAFDRFLEETGLKAEVEAQLDKVNYEDVASVERASRVLHDLIHDARFPKDLEEEILIAFAALDSEFVAVRSSATAEDSSTASWAGELESYLNTTEKNLLGNVKKCWASLFTPRAIVYRMEKGMRETHVSVAVVVQKMIQSDVAGIAFTVHPVTKDHDQMIIEACWGLGEFIVGGIVTPDSYIVSKRTNGIIENYTSEQDTMLIRGEHGNVTIDVPADKREAPKLNAKQIESIGTLCIAIEKHYGFPCDIEWGMEAGEFYILQSRPITTLHDQDFVTETKKEYSPGDYVRMFAGKSFPFILSDIFLNYYNVLGVLSVQDKRSLWMSFLPKTSQERTLREGRELYTTKARYDAYNEGFKNYIASSASFFESVLGKQEISAEEVEKFFKLASDHFSFYSKTEFFYTDLLEPEAMVLSVQEFDTLKLNGRAYLNKLIFEESGYIRSLLKKLSYQANVPEELLLNYCVFEVVDLIKGGKKIDENEVIKRSAFFASQNLTLFGDASLEIVDELLLSYRGLSDIIKGKVANKGKVRGKARVLVPDWKDFDKISIAVQEMEKGEILVAETTSPDIIQACKKAAAIITNQGGMLSHAAIISRELGIPCIIGTDKDVILNIQTGDELEVDANTGVVRIYKK